MIEKINCPICGKTTFTTEFEVCNYCGWQNDSVQLENPKYPGGSNDLSLVEYKKLYEMITLEHPSYQWIKNQKVYDRIVSNFTFPPYKCKCCGIGAINVVGEKCDNCGWIDSQLQNYFVDLDIVFNIESLQEMHKNSYK